MFDLFLFPSELDVDSSVTSKKLKRYFPGVVLCINGSPVVSGLAVALVLTV